ncbi:MAG: PHB depolymerase family esterase [Burkholderiales bacterium]
MRRYEFSERLADILGESRRDLRFRVTLMVTEGLEPAGPRGRGAPMATPRYAASLLIGCMAAPQQSDTVEAIRCYSELVPALSGPDAVSPRVRKGPVRESEQSLPELPGLDRGARFGEIVARLIEMGGADPGREALRQWVFGIWVNRGYPIAGVQFATQVDGQYALITQGFELAEGAAPPSWLDPERGGRADPGLFHTVFLPARKLADIGMLTAVPHGRRSIVLKKVGPKLAALANMTKLGQQPRFQRRWERLLSTLDAVKAWSDEVDGEQNRFTLVRDFGSNPGDLAMYKYVPARLPASAPLVVVLHGCTQSAASYDKGSGWSTLADRYGFALLLPQQGWKNNPLRCFNWFRPEHTGRDRGEALSIKQMIDRMFADHDLDRTRVHVTGLSSGGAMTAVMLATYPDVFAGGAVLAGVPYGAASGVGDAFEAIFQGPARTPEAWGDIVRGASSHHGPWPKVSIWHGDADKSVNPANAEETVKQWANVHGLPVAHTIDMPVDGHRRRVWQDARGQDLIESYTIAGMAHGAAVDPGSAEHQCGTAAPFFNAAGISSSYRIASFWGLVGERLDTAVAEDAPRNAGATQQADGPAHTGAEEREEPKTAGAGEGAAGGRRIDVDGMVAKSLEMAGLLRGRQKGSSGQGGKGTSPLGLDVHNIIATSLEAAGLLKSGSRSATRASSGVPFGIDVPRIIATALEAAGVLDTSGTGAPAASGGARSLAGSGWEGEGWELLHDEARAFRGGPMLHARVTSGDAAALGRQVRSASKQMTLGAAPELSYVRRIALSAAANPYARASFRILVDGVAVDEVSAVGMDYSEGEWTRRTGVDLAQFAGRTVTVTLEVAAATNARNEVDAEVWLDEIAVDNATAMEPA